MKTCERCGWLVTSNNGECEHCAALANMMSINKVIARAEQTIAEAGAVGKIVFIIHSGDQIVVRDNSGVTGLTSDELMKTTLRLLELLFPE